MSFYLLMIAAVLLICICLNKLSSKLGIPMLLTFILLGMAFGSDGLMKISFDNYAMTEQICSVSLIFIMFYGGFGTNWKKAKPVAIKATLLSTLGVILTAAFTGLFCYLALHIDFWESFLIGSVIASTDAASVFSILRSKRLNLKNNTASLLEMESGSNDPCSYMLTIIILAVISGQSTGSLFTLVLAQLVWGIAIGVAVALAAAYVLSHYKLPANGFDTIFIFGMALVAYAAASILGGNGYLSVYIAGIILGNKPIPNKKSLVHFFDGLTGLMQILLFFLLGLLSFPSQMPAIALSALAIALFLTFVARPLAVFALLTPFKVPLNQQLVVSWAGLRGAASIVFAIVATVSPAHIQTDVFHIVFFIVLFSISIQGSLLTPVAKLLNMIDEHDNVLKTFNDYSEEIPVQFVRLSITPNHPWIDKKIKDITILPGLLLVLILRGKERIMPKGNVTVSQGDIIVLSAPSLTDDVGIQLTELTIDKDHTWLGHPISEVRVGPDKLIMLVRRGNRVLIPSGRTVIRDQDVLVIGQL